MGVLSAVEDSIASDKQDAVDDAEGDDVEGGDSSDSAAPRFDTTPDGREQRPASRRSKAAKEALDLARSLKTQQEDLARRLEESDRRYQESTERYARLEGAYEALRTQPSAAKQEPAEENPDELRRRADDALTQGNYTEYRRLDQQANKVDLNRALRSQREQLTEEWRKSQPQQMDPMVQALLSRHEHVAMSQNGLAAVDAEARILQAYGHRPGPELLAAAFKNANDRLAAAKKSQNGSRASGAGYDPSSAAILAGLTPGKAADGASGGDGEEQIKLSDEERSMAKDARMSEKEYWLWKTNPDKARATMSSKRK